MKKFWQQYGYILIVILISFLVIGFSFWSLLFRLDPL